MGVLQKIRVPGPRRWARWTAGAALSAVWWWAVLRLALQPAQAGPVAGVVAAGGWGLSLIPLHSVPGPGSRPSARRSSGRRPSGGSHSGRPLIPRPRRSFLPGHRDATIGAQDPASGEGLASDARKSTV